MAVIYVDPLNGTDNADAGRGETEGTGSVSGAGAYASISYALANYGSFSTTEGNTIYLADTAADVLSSALSFYAAGLTSANAHMAIVGYHYDGSNGGTAGALTVNLPFGRSISGGEIDGNDAVSSITDANERYITFRNLKLHSTTAQVTYMLIECHVENCEIYNGGTTQTARGGNFFVNCKCHTDVAGGAGLYNAYHNINCEVSDHDEGFQVTQNYATVTGCLVKDFDDAGIYCGGNMIRMYGNTIDGTGSNSDARGIEIYTSDGASVHDNLITNVSGASGVGFSAVSGAVVRMHGNNAYYNCTTHKSLSDTPSVVVDDITESSDPFTDRSTGDYSLVSGANSNDAALYKPYGADSNIGAWQEKPTGGGGGGETTSIFMA